MVFILGHQAVIGQVFARGHQGPTFRTATPAKSAPSLLSSPVKGYSHWHVDRQGASEASNRGIAPSGSAIPTVVTFFPHPQEFFSGQSRPLLTPLEEKTAQISRLGIKQLVLLPFNYDLAALTPQEFVDILLIQQLQAQHILAWVKTFCFGQKPIGHG